ncbi:MAG: hypothetical protein AABX47_06235 [Nanoarchaeota archaeon]
MKKRCCSKGAKGIPHKMLSSKKGFISPEPSNKAIQILKLFASKLTGAGGVESNSLRTILFNVDENAARIVSDSWNEKSTRHQIERDITTIEGLIKAARSERDEKKKGDLLRKIDAGSKEWIGLYQRDIMLLQEVWQRHCYFINDLIGFEREIFGFLTSAKGEDFPEAQFVTLKAEALRLALEIRKGTKQELDLSQAIKSSTFSVSKWDPRDSDSLDRVDRKLGYRIDGLQKSIKSSKKKLNDAFARGDPEDTASAVTELVGLLQREWVEAHMVGLNSGVLLARLVEQRERFEKALEYYSQMNPQFRTEAEGLVHQAHSIESEALSLIRQNAQQVELRKQTLPTD